MFPYFSYRDANAALEWLESSFGFERVVAYPDEDGSIVHAEMRFGGGALIMGTGEPPRVVDPGAVSPNAHGVYVQVEDVDAHHEREGHRRADRLPAPGHGVQDAEVSRPGPRGIRAELRDIQTFGLTTDTHKPFDEGRDTWHAR